MKTRQEKNRMILADEVHNKLRAILQDYNNPEWGDCIIDEICELFNFPKTPEE